MALLSVIRRWHLREGIPIREAARRTGLSRNTVRKYLASQVIEPAYPPRKTPSKLDDYGETLTNWLFRESRRHRKLRQVNKRFYAMVSHYLYEPEFCNPASGWEKGRKQGTDHGFIRPRPTSPPRPS